MTKPDLTNTAPKRIYLDIGDQFALERVASGDLRWDLLDGVTWSEGNDSGVGIPYVRADLVPTLAASGAAPLTDAERAELDQLRLLAGGQSCIPKVIEALGPMSLWSAAALKDHIDREVAAALASPQVAPEGFKLVPVKPTREMADAAVQAICYGPEGGFTRIAGPSRCWAAMLAAVPATPVQVAPPNLSSPLAGDCRTVGGFLSDVMTAAGLVEHGRQCKPLAERISVACSDLRARIFQGSTPVAPQDDARDAMTISAAACDADISAVLNQISASPFCVAAFRRILSTTAAKPTEPTPGAAT